MSTEGHSRMEYARRKVGVVTAWSQTSVHRRGQRRTDDRWSASSSPPSDTKQARLRRRAFCVLGSATAKRTWNPDDRDARPRNVGAGVGVEPTHRLRLARDVVDVHHVALDVLDRDVVEACLAQHSDGHPFAPRGSEPGAPGGQ